MTFPVIRLILLQISLVFYFHVTFPMWDLPLMAVVVRIPDPSDPCPRLSVARGAARQAPGIQIPGGSVSGGRPLGRGDGSYSPSPGGGAAGGAVSIWTGREKERGGEYWQLGFNSNIFVSFNVLK